MNALGHWSLYLVMGVLLASVAVAQDVPQDAALEEALGRGVEAFDAGEAETAIDYLDGVFAAAAAYVSPVHGAAACWLGRAYDAAEDPDAALSTWETGLTALDAAGLFDPCTADGLVRDAFGQQQKSAYPLAAQAYLALLESLDQTPAPAAALLRPHLEELVPVLPANLVQQTGLDRLGARDDALDLPAGAGARLVAWWRSEDVAPASRVNERLFEHLERVAHARAHYRFKGTLDDRGLVYLRLGPPSRQTSITFDDLQFRNKVLDRNLTLNASDFPDNEFWFYEHIDDAAQFLFHDRQGPYRLGEVRDLLPASLRGGVSASARGFAKSRAVVRSLEAIYEQLALYHPDFATRYQDVAAFSSLLDDEEFVMESYAVRPNQQIDAGSEGGDEEGTIRDAVANSQNSVRGAGLPGGSFPVSRPDLYAQHALMEGHAADERIAFERDARVPYSYTNAFDDAEPLPMAVRTARFLDADGTTRTEVYWGLPGGALQLSRASRRAMRREGLPTDRYVLLATLVQKDMDYRERVVRLDRYALPSLDEAGDAPLTPQMSIATGDTGRYHLALQWDQVAVVTDKDDQVVAYDERVKVNTFRADTLTALDADATALEMSDLKPMVLLDLHPSPDAEALDAEVLEAAVLYPFRVVQTSTPLVLYFEVYHLVFGPDDRTHYTVEYEVRGREPGRLRRLIGRGEPDVTAARASYTGSRRTAQERLLLDLSEWEGRGDLQVTLRVTDETTGRQVERSLDFELIDE